MRRDAGRFGPAGAKEDTALKLPAFPETTAPDEPHHHLHRDFIRSNQTSHTNRTHQHPQLEPKKFWEQLLFLDDQNYGGIQVQGSLFGEDGGGEVPPQDDDGADDDDGEAVTSNKKNRSKRGGDDDSEEESEEEDPEGLQDSDEESEEEEEEEEGGDEGARRRRRLRRFKEGSAGGKSPRKKKTGPKVCSLSCPRKSILMTLL